MIVYRSVLDEFVREEQRFCGDCAEHTLRHALQRAAAKGDANFLVCSPCHARWVPESDINYAVRGWMLIFVPESPMLAAVLCADCASSHPEPAVSLRKIARLILRQSRGPLQ